MLKHLTKYFKPASAESQEEVEMTEQDKATLVAAETKTAELTVALETAVATMAEQAAQMAQLTANFEAAQAALNASEEAKKEFAAQAATKRLEARTAALSAAIGKDNKNLATMLAAFDSLSTAQFSAAVNAMTVNFEAEKNTPMFNEAGVAATVDASKVQEESKEAKILKAKYQKTNAK